MLVLLDAGFLFQEKVVQIGIACVTMAGIGFINIPLVSKWTDNFNLTL